MNRRLFFERIAAVVGLAATPSLVRAAAPRRVELQKSPVAGFQYHQGEAVWPQLAVGTYLDLVREPDNVHDGRAVRVDWQGHKIGYLPRIDNAAVSQLLDRGERLATEIVALRTSRNPWDRVELAVFLLQRGGHHDR